jgi:hypothetical protein
MQRIAVCSSPFACAQNYTEYNMAIKQQSFGQKKETARGNQFLHQLDRRIPDIVENAPEAHKAIGERFV